MTVAEKTENERIREMFENDPNCTRVEDVKGTTALLLPSKEAVAAVRKQFGLGPSSS